MEYALTANHLMKKYGRSNALDNFSMQVPKGAIYGFVGKNGAGKTTLIRLACGLQSPTSGTFTLYGVKNTQKGIRKGTPQNGGRRRSPFDLSGSVCRG